MAVNLHCNKRLDAYSITSSARPSSVTGKVMPRALAVFMLMMSSILVACWLQCETEYHASIGSLAHHSRGRNAAILSLCDDREAPKRICRKITRGHGAAETASCLADEALPQLLRNKFCGMFAAAKR